MKKPTLLPISLLLTTCYLLLPPPAFAAVPPGGGSSGIFARLNQAIGLNPALWGSGSGSSVVGPIISAFLPYFLIIAGLILLFMLISGGFQLLTAGNSPESAEKGKKRITAAIAGFFIIFSSYWITQIVEVVFGVNIL